MPSDKGSAIDILLNEACSSAADHYRALLLLGMTVEEFSGLGLLPQLRWLEPNAVFMNSEAKAGAEGRSRHTGHIRGLAYSVIKNA